MYQLKGEASGRGGGDMGVSMTGNLGICRSEIGSHLYSLSKRKADFTADGSAAAGLQSPGAQWELLLLQTC